MRIAFFVPALLATLSRAQFPSDPTDVTIITSTLDANVKISYKQTDLCETTPGVKTFSGFVHLPKSSLTDLTVNFDINTYFLFFEARNDPKNAPLVIYLAGGPGESSTFTALSGETGPCVVGVDGNSTTLNPWSFNIHANMLYIDQPVGAGFSYTSLLKGTYDVLQGTVTPLTDYNGDVPPSNVTFGEGIYSDPGLYTTTNTSISSAQALWHFGEHWLTQFPEYRSKNKNIGIWGNSAAGMWVPETAVQFDKNLKAADENSSLSEWSIENIGITNGVLDSLHDLPFTLEYAYNNTYGQFMNDSAHEQAKQADAMPGGCIDQVIACRAAGNEGDPLGKGTNDTVNQLCQKAQLACVPDLLVFPSQNRDAQDIAIEYQADILGGDPCPYYLPVSTFLNQAWTQKALGVPLNFTYSSNTILADYTTQISQPNVGTGDLIRVDGRNIEYLLQNDIKVAFVYGDRDGRCPWLGAEDFANTANYTSHEEMKRAGYEFIQSNQTYQGGAVKQFEKFSFSRIFQAGHSVEMYQPQTVELVFARTLAGKDVATGNKDVCDGYSTQGPQSSFYMTSESLPYTPPTCMILGSFQNQSVWPFLMESNGTSSAMTK